jgi:hypothetical protein
MGLEAELRPEAKRTSEELPMPGAMRGLRWRLAFAVVGLALVGMWWMASGGPSHILQIDHSWAGGMLIGAEVVLDGEVIGTLERRSGQMVTGFRVERGEHEVLVRSEQCEGRPESFVADLSHRRVVFMAEVQEGFSGSRFRCLIALQ